MNCMRNVEQPLFWERINFAFFTAILVAFSSDLRLGLNLQLNARPDFQFFEMVCILFSILLLVCSPWIILRGKLALENVDHLPALFLLNALFLAIWATDILHNVSRTKDFFWAYLLYILLRYSPLSKRGLTIIVRLSVLAACFWSLLGIIQLLGWDDGLGGEIYRLFLASRAHFKTVVDPFAGEVIQAGFAHGIYLYPQNFIYYLLCPFFLSLGLAHCDRRWILPALIIFTAMLGTLSKTVVLLLAVFLATYLLYRFFHNSVMTLGVLAAIAGAAIFAMVSFGHAPFWKQALATFVWRVEIWVDALSMLLENPWLLVKGDGTALLASTYSRVNYPNPHNMLIYLSIEYGIIGAGLFFTFIFLRLRQLRSFIDRPNMDQPAAKALFWGLLVFLSMGIVDDMFVQTQITALIFFYLGLLSRLVEPNESRMACQQVLATEPRT